MSAQKINILIVEDEALVAMDLAHGLEKDGYHIAGIADNAKEAVELFAGNEVDIVLMDVNIIGDKDGIDTATILLQQKQVPVIYLTAFTDPATVDRAKHTHPAAFLTKPYSITNVRIAIEMAIYNFAAIRQEPSGKVVPFEKREPQASPETADKETILRMNDYIFVKHNYAFVKISLSDIWYVEAENNYVQLVTGEKKVLLRLSFAQLLEKINYKPLVRIHRSYAVNINAIQSFTEQEVLIHKTALPVGRSYREDFLRHFNFR